MIGLLPLGKVVAAISVLYAVCMSLIIFVLHGNTFTLIESILFMGGGFAMLSTIVTLMFSTGWRYLWQYFPSLNNYIFPDLEGQWEMDIFWSSESGSGAKKATATIKQSLLKISMEVDSEDSESETLVAKPKKDPLSDRPILYYAYSVTPHQGGSSASASYKGMAVLKLAQHDLNKLSGNYFTDRNTQGRFSMKRNI